MQGGWNTIYILALLGTSRTVAENSFHIWLEVDKVNHITLWLHKVCVYVGC